MLTLKLIHVSAVLISIIGFSVRGILMIIESSYLNKKWVKIVPHIVDTILLVSAILLTIRIGQYPITDGWLTAKLVALFAYIFLGVIALKRGKTKQIRVLAFVAAILVFAYTVLVAITRTPLIIA